MAVFTQVSPGDAAKLLELYDIGTLVDLQPIPQGVENTNYHLFTTTGRYILTLFEGRTDPMNASGVFILMEHWRGKGIACPVALEDNIRRTNRLNKFVHECAGKSAAILSFLEGRGVADQEVTPELCQQMGDLVARMHAPDSDIKNFFSNTVSIGAWQSLAATCGDRMETVEPGLTQMVRRELNDLARQWQKFQELPRGVIHADLFPDNVFIDDHKKICGVIDFYFSCWDVLIYDLAIVVNAWCFDDQQQFNAIRFRHLMNGYEARRRLSDPERQWFGFALRAASVRILMTRLHDLLFHPAGALVTPKDPRAYLARLRFHQENEALV